MTSATIIERILSLSKSRSHVRSAWIWLIISLDPSHSKLQKLHKKGNYELNCEIWLIMTFELFVLKYAKKELLIEAYFLEQLE